MIRIFDQGQTTEEMGAVVRGGLLVTATERGDIEKLLRRCLALRFSPELRAVLDFNRKSWEPMRALYADLLVGGTDEKANNQTSTLMWDTISSIAEKGAQNALENLAVALAAVVNEWEEAPTTLSAEGLQLFLGIANPAASTSEEFELAFSSPTPLLVLQQGSLLAGFVLERSIKARGWVVGVGAKAARLVGRSPQAAMDRIVEGARKKALTKCRPLTRLDELDEKDRSALSKRQLVIIFLHGLFATDVGTFDGLIDQIYKSDPRLLLSNPPWNGPKGSTTLGGRAEMLKALQTKLQDKIDACSAKLKEERVVPRAINDAVDSAIGFVGWPHNSLTGISINASDLTEIIENTFLPEPPKIMFVCHSRGGLVARATIANLLGTTRHEIWKRALVGLITFGTPHDGASLAEHDLKDYATYFLLMQSTGRVTSLLDVLTYLNARTAEGLDQLKPFEATTEMRPRAYIDELYAVERNVVKDPTGRRMPPVTVIGGMLDANKLADWKRKAASALMTRWLATSDHDMVVELKSSLSKRLGADITARMNSDHFSYFTTLNTTPEVANLALGCVWAEVDLAAAFAMQLPKTVKLKTPRAATPE